MCDCKPTMTVAEYEARAVPRLARIDLLSKRIDFESLSWRNTPDGQLWQRLMDQQGRDVVYVPTNGCMNLAATVNVVLYDRAAKQAG